MTGSLGASGRIVRLRAAERIAAENTTKTARVEGAPPTYVAASIEAAYEAARSLSDSLRPRFDPLATVAREITAGGGDIPAAMRASRPGTKSNALRSPRTTCGRRGSTGQPPRTGTASSSRTGTPTPRLGQAAAAATPQQRPPTAAAAATAAPDAAAAAAAAPQTGSSSSSASADGDAQTAAPATDAADTDAAAMAAAPQSPPMQQLGRPRSAARVGGVSFAGPGGNAVARLVRRLAARRALKPAPVAAAVAVVTRAAEALAGGGGAAGREDEDALFDALRLLRRSGASAAGRELATGAGAVSRACRGRRMCAAGGFRLFVVRVGHACAYSLSVRVVLCVWRGRSRA